MPGNPRKTIGKWWENMGNSGKLMVNRRKTIGKAKLKMVIESLSMMIFHGSRTGQIDITDIIECIEFMIIDDCYEQVDKFDESVLKT